MHGVTHQVTAVDGGLNPFPWLSEPTWSPPLTCARQTGLIQVALRGLTDFSSDGIAQVPCPLTFVTGRLRLTRVGVAPILASSNSAANVFILAREAWSRVLALLLPVLR